MTAFLLQHQHWATPPLRRPRPPVSMGWWVAVMSTLLASVVWAANPAKDAIEEFNQAPRPVRSDHPLLPVLHLDVDGAAVSYTVSRHLATLARAGRTFRVRRWVRRATYSAIELESQAGNTRSRVRVTIAAPKGLQVDGLVPLVLRDLFEFREPLRTHRFVGSTTGMHRLHLATCNHLPPPDMAMQFSTREEAERQGYQPCAICFAVETAPSIRWYAPIRAAATANARMYERVQRVVADDAIQTRLQAFGDSLLECFPFEPQGFQYRFRVVHSEFPMTRAYPTGYVYVADKLYDSIDSRWELAFLLAREIAHVEMHIPWYLPPTAKELQSAYSRYRRDAEIEADLAALACLWKRGAPPGVGQQVALALRKSEAFSADEPAQERSGRHDWHPTLRERTEWVVTPRYTFPSASGIGMGGDNETLLRGALLAVEKREDELVAVVAVQASQALDLIHTLNAIEIQSRGGSWIRFDLLDPKAFVAETRRVVLARHRIMGWPRYWPDLDVTDGCLRFLTLPELKNRCTED